MKRSYLIIFLFSIALNFFYHFQYLSLDIQGLHSWRQSQTMWNVRNFARYDNNILHPRINQLEGNYGKIYRYEFPVLQWSMAMMYKYWGEHIEIIRSYMFLIGLLASLGMYFLILQLTKDDYTALCTCIIFQYSPIFFHYSFNPFPDILALTGIVWYLYFIFRWKEKEKLSYLIFAAMFLLIATAAKFQFLMFSIISIVLFFQYIKSQRVAIAFTFFLIQFIFLLPIMLWYIWVIPDWQGNPVLSGVFGSQISFVEYFHILGFQLIKMIPNKLLSFSMWPLIAFGIYFVLKNPKKNYLVFYVAGILLLYLLLQLTTILRDHDYYLLPLLPLFMMLSAYGISFIKKKNAMAPILIPIIAIVSIVYCLWITNDWYSLNKTSFNNDVFTHASQLKNAVPNKEKCIILNDPSSYIFAYKVDKLGYVFKDNNLPLAWIEDMIKNKDVHYMYSDSYVINNSPTFLPFIKKIILKAGTVMVYELQLPMPN